MKKSKLVLIGIASLLISACQNKFNLTSDSSTVSPSQSPASNQATPTESTRPTTTATDHQQVKIKLGNQPLTVEIVRTPESITQGLSGRSEIGSQGMLFLLPENRVPTFWMKEMKFDLDMIWLRAGKVVVISERVPKPLPTTPLSELPTISPQQPADMVLEVVAGQAQSWGITVGDSLTFISES